MTENEPSIKFDLSHLKGLSDEELRKQGYDPVDWAEEITEEVPEEKPTPKGPVLCDSVEDGQMCGAALDPDGQRDWSCIMMGHGLPPKHPFLSKAEPVADPEAEKDRLIELVAAEAAEEHRKLVERQKRWLRITQQAKDELAEETAAAEPGLKFFSRIERAARPALAWRISRLAVQGAGVAVWFGRQGSMKSFMLLDLAMCLANGRDEWQGLSLTHDPNKPDVVIVLGEGVTDFPQREDAWIEAHGGSADHLWTIENQAVSFTTKTGLERFCEALRASEIRPCLIAFDTQGLTAAAGVDENNRTEMRDVYLNIKSLAAEFGCTVVLVTHPGNDPKNWNRPAGSSTQGQDADLILDIRHSKAKGGTVWVDKVKSGERGWGWSFTGELMPEANSLVVRHTGSSNDDDLIDSGESMAVWDAIEAEPGITFNKLADASKIRKEDVTKIVEFFVAHGQVRVDKKGQSHKHYLV